MSCNYQFRHTLSLYITPNIDTMKKQYIIVYACLLCLSCAPCSVANHQDTKDNMEATAGKRAKEFRLPDVPDMLKDPEARAAYLSMHYWDHFDFSDTSMISLTNVTEQAFVDFISILPYSPQAVAAVDTLYRRAMADKDMLHHFISLGDKYLYEPNSPMHNEELHILILRALVNNPCLEEEEKMRPRLLLEMALKNRPGDKAADFTITCRNGKRLKLSQIESPYLLVYFNDPDCQDCRLVKERMASSLAVDSMVSADNLKILSVCVEGKTNTWKQASYPANWIDGYDAGQQLTHEQVYDLKAIPTLYLLDADKKVILKDASVEQIEMWVEMWLVKQ